MTEESRRWVEMMRFFAEFILRRFIDEGLRMTIVDWEMVQ